jgi:EAL domain-containing protein (putative c-di-GMP-specific phosphodiesterase class I)
MTYQPILRTRDGSIFGWEALLRTSEAAVQGPLDFLDLAERLGKLDPLGRAIRASVARTARRTRGAMFFVNLHADDLLNESLYDPAAPLSAVAPDVVLELTERSPIESLPDIHDRIRRLRTLGFRLAIDDLGSGHARLAAFASLAPDFVKLDRGIVHSIDRDAVRRDFVESLVSLSHEMGIPVVAEGIEAASEQQVATDLGCDLMQGFLFRRPEELAIDARFELGGEGWTSAS